MQRLATLGAALALTTLAFAQSPLTTAFNSNNGGSAGGAVYFDLVVNTTIEITSIDINTTSTAAGGIDVYLGCGITTFQSPNHAPASNWVLVTSGTGTGAGQDNPTSVTLTPPLALQPGTYPVAIVANAPWSHRYTSAGTTTTSFMTTEATLIAGGASNVPFSGSQFFSRLFNGSLHYTTTPTTTPINNAVCAKSLPYGDGCGVHADSFYEFGASLATFDLGGTATTANVITATYLGPQGYQVSQGTSAFHTPIGVPVLSNATTPGAMGDDTMSLPLPVPATWNGATGTWPFPGGSCSVFHANSNGYVLCGPTTATTGDFSPSSDELLGSLPASHSGTARLAVLWADWHAGRNTTTNPTSGVYYDVDPSGTTVYVTWQEIGEFATSGAGASLNTFQVAIHENGDFEYRYAEVQRTAGTSPWLVGFSKGNVGGPASFDPGSTDISAAVPFSTNGPDSGADLLLASNRPVIGTTLTLITTEIPANANLTVSRVTTQQASPPIDLGQFGAPRCFAHVGISGADNVFLFGSPSVTRNIAIPNDPSLAGFTVYSQSASVVPNENPLGIITSNGLELLVGTY